MPLLPFVWFAMSFGHFVKKINTSEVEARVIVTIKSMTLSEDASDKKFMVWLKRNGKSRGTGLIRAQGCHVNWNETVAQTCTLLRSRGSGFLKSKRFNVVVIWNSCYEEAPGQVFGTLEVNLAESSKLTSYSLSNCNDPFAKIDLAIDCQVVGGDSEGNNAVGNSGSNKNNKNKKKKNKQPVGGFGDAMKFYNEQQKKQKQQQQRQKLEQEQDQEQEMNRDNLQQHQQQQQQYERSGLRQEYHTHKQLDESYGDESEPYFERREDGNRTNNDDDRFNNGYNRNESNSYANRDGSKQHNTKDKRNAYPPSKPSLNSWM